MGLVNTSKSNVIKQRHETKIHVQLLMTMEQGTARIIG